QGSIGGLPSISSKASATHSPSSYDQSKRGLGTDGGSPPAIRASARCIWGLSGLREELTALMKSRLPSARRRRAATPGEKPPGRSSAEATDEPILSTSVSITWDGRAAQGRRAPSASGPARPS